MVAPAAAGSFFNLKRYRGRDKMRSDGEEDQSFDEKHRTTFDIPSFTLLSSDPEDEINAPGNHPPTTSHQQDNTFASDFFRCGSDWSCLLLRDQDGIKKNRRHRGDFTSPRNGEPHSERNLKQTNLFQMWGLKRPNLQDVPSPPPVIVKKMKIGGEGSVRFRNAADTVNRPRLCPFYKKIPATPFTVDAFRYGRIEGCSAYFLTHFHYDHYGGLNKGWSHGSIYCTPLTACLLITCLSVNPSFIFPMELNTEHLIDRVRVTLLEANHCPGAAMILFGLSNGQSYLHTGDFRACKLMQTYPLLANERVNVLYLDTTYCNPKYKFPSKEDVLSYVVRITQNSLKKQPKTLVVVGAYSIGKECVYLAISKALGVKIYTNASRRKTLQSFGWPKLSEILSSNGKDTLLHVLPISSLRFEALKDYLKNFKGQFAAILAFRPTGWTYSERIGNQLDLIKPSSKGNVTIYGVPYSEHSSFSELREFVQFLRPDKIIPTVNVGTAANRDKMHSYFREWLKG